MDTKTKACAICSLSAKSNCKVCGRALCKACTLYQVMEGRACEPCHRQYLSVPPAPEPCVPDAFVEDIRAFCKVGPEWVEEKPVKDTKVWSRVMPGSGVKAFRYETDMECSVESLNQLLHEQLIERHVEWNATFLNGLMCEERGPDSNVQGWRFKTTGSDRDFCVARRRVVDEADGGVLLVERSVKHRKAPIVSGCIRADLPFNFRHFVKHEDSTDEKPKVRYTYANLTYVGGWISDWLLNKGNAGVSTEEMEHIEAVCSKK